MTLLGEVNLHEVDTPQGTGRWHVSPAAPGAEQGSPRALVVLGHGAGGGVDGIDLVALAALLPAHGITVARFEQPWKVAGKKVATRPPTLDEAWLAAVPALVTGSLGRQLHLGGAPLVVGGHSAGARVACRCAAALGAAAVLGLSFPLHPPGKPESSRLDELLAPTVPVLVLQGDRDPFGTPAEVNKALSSSNTHITVVEVTGAGHPLSVPAKVRTAADHRDWLAANVLDFLGAHAIPV
ncbi:alpha/beta family hydrolase [Propionibacteriaceae bacterium G1746]|uniref:alpha/beta hydrolase family protein n=1 Tax=Aestuariimicrobium sp. G57 TaxID=3418485 RepID=UPI003C209F63